MEHHYGVPYSTLRGVDFSMFFYWKSSRLATLIDCLECQSLFLSMNTNTITLVCEIFPLSGWNVDWKHSPTRNALTTRILFLISVSFWKKTRPPFYFLSIAFFSLSLVPSLFILVVLFDMCSQWSLHVFPGRLIAHTLSLVMSCWKMRLDYYARHIPETLKQVFYGNIFDVIYSLMDLSMATLSMATNSPFEK